MENKHRQADEIEALCSIYGDQWQTEDELNQAYCVAVTEGKCDAVLHIKLPPEYPSIAPPQYQLSAPTLSREDKQSLSDRLESIYLDNIGESIIYQWVEATREFLQMKFLNQTNCDPEPEIVDLDVNMISQETSIISRLEIHHGEVITDRKSKFQAHAAIITSVDQVKDMLSTLLENKKFAQATHNIYAYRVLKDGLPGCMAQDCEDDGENAAGSRLLHLLQTMGAMNVMVVVSRWYGGVHLGPDRFRHINNAARQVLQQMGFVNKK
ncbi:protein IMPACT-like [Homalodisca vitripennis]|uniref:protein IMPACT-like n=1 Tax=Homalodisca vitripennis TaxID=197043 RepID=UPI001EEADD51|nr:protein IMPACT-like [Homalodisca vitripennis]